MRFSTIAVCLITLYFPCASRANDCDEARAEIARLVRESTELREEATSGSNGSSAQLRARLRAAQERLAKCGSAKQEPAPDTRKDKPWRPASPDEYGKELVEEINKRVPSEGCEKTNDWIDEEIEKFQKLSDDICDIARMQEEALNNAELFSDLSVWITHLDKFRIASQLACQTMKDFAGDSSALKGANKVCEIYGDVIDEVERHQNLPKEFERECTDADKLLDQLGETVEDLQSIKDYVKLCQDFARSEAMRKSAEAERERLKEQIEPQIRQSTSQCLSALKKRDIAADAKAAIGKMCMPPPSPPIGPLGHASGSLTGA